MGSVQVYPSNLRSNNLQIEEQQKERNDQNLHHHVSNQHLQLQSTFSLKNVSLVRSSNNEINFNSSNFLPSCFNNEITPIYIESVKATQVDCLRETKNKTINFALKIINCNLISAEVCKYFKSTLQEEREHYKNQELMFLKNANAKLVIINRKYPLHAISYYSDCLIMEYHGIDCRDLNQVCKYLEKLAISVLLDSNDAMHKRFEKASQFNQDNALEKARIAIDPLHAEINQKLAEAIIYIQDRWYVLEREGLLDEATHRSYREHLDQVLDHKNLLKNLFLNNPRLFELATDASYRAFFDKYPELKSIEAFKLKHSDVTELNFDGILNDENLDRFLVQAKSSPFIEKMFFLDPAPILTDVAAAKLVEAMLQKRSLKVVVGNAIDAATFIAAFAANPTLPNPVPKNMLSFQQAKSDDLKLSDIFFFSVNTNI